MDAADAQRLAGAIQSQGQTLGNTNSRVAENARRLEELSARFESLTVSGPALREYDIVTPERYRGEPEKCQNFLAMLALKFKMQPRTFSTEAARVAHAVSLLSAKAQDWGLAELQAQSKCCETFEAFSAELTAVFNPRAPRRVAASRLFKLTQGRSTVAEYTIEFRTLAASCKWTDETLIDKFYEGLASYVKDELVSRTLPTTLRELIELANFIDQRVTARQMEPSGSGDRRPPPRQGAVMERSKDRVEAPTRLWQPLPPRPPSPGEEAMQVDRLHISPEERQRRLHDGVCLYCAQAGHRARNCPLNDRAHRRVERR